MEQHEGTDDAYKVSGHAAAAATFVRFRWDPVVEVASVGESFEELGGYDASWLVADQDRFWQLFALEDRDRLRSFLTEPPASFDDITLRLIHRDGYAFPVELLLAPAPGDDGGPRAADGLLVDASQGTYVERAVARLLGDVAEELRGPIGSLTVATTTLGRTDVELSEDQRRSALRIIDESGRRLGGLMMGLLELAQLRERPVAARQPVAMLELVERVVATEMARASTEIAVTGDSSAVAVVEPASVERAVTELVRNAIQHGAPPISVQVTGNVEHVVVSVSDDGPGVPPELVPRLFEPFSGRRSSARPRQRPGLGLAIALAAAQRAGGMLTYRPRQMTGAIFHLRFGSSKDRRAGAVASMPTLRVVLFARDRLSGDALAAGLQSSPRVVEVTVVVGTQVPDTLVGGGRVDVVVLDLDGVSVDVGEIRRFVSSASARLIFVRSAPTLADLASAVELGAAGLVPKDLGLGALTDAVERVMHEDVFVDAATLIALHEETRSPDYADVLTDREFDVLRLLAQGLDVSRIARELGLQVSTARGYIKSILSKLEAHSQLQAVVTAARLGLVSLTTREHPRRRSDDLRPDG